MRVLACCVLAALALGCLRRVPFEKEAESGTSGAGSSVSGPTVGSASTSGTTAGSTAGSVSGATSGGPGGSSSTTGSPFIMEPDFTPGPYCDPQLQDCAPGEKCTTFDPAGGEQWFEAFGCFPVDPDPAGLFEPCSYRGGPGSGLDDCDVGLFCFELDEDGVGVCWAYCTYGEVGGELGCPDDTVQQGFLCQHCPCMCIKQCDPVLQDCKAGSSCLPRSGSQQFVCVTDASGDEGQYGDVCEYINACDPGLFCANSEYVPGCVSPIGCCNEFCDLTLPDPDSQCSGQAQGLVCTPWYEAGMAPPGFEHVGACAPAP